MRLSLLAALAAVVAAFAVGTARSASVEDCSHNPASTWNAIAFNAEYGFRPYLLGIGASWWRGKERLASPAIESPQALCGATSRRLAAEQQHFYTLLRAFPLKPTRAQWKARFRPLMQAAISADADFLTVVSGPTRKPIVADKEWLVAKQNTPFGKTLQ